MPDPEPVRQPIRSQTRVPSSSRLERMDTHDEYPQRESPPRRANMNRSSTFQGPTTIYRESATGSDVRKNSVPNDAGAMRAQLRPTNRVNTSDVFGDPSDDSTLNSGSPDRSYSARSVSPATSHGSAGAAVTLSATTNGRKGPPPPPPSRAKKPPPPPPMKRAITSAVSVNQY